MTTLSPNYTMTPAEWQAYYGGQIADAKSAQRMLLRMVVEPERSEAERAALRAALTAIEMHLVLLRQWAAEELEAA